MLIITAAAIGPIPDAGHLGRKLRDVQVPAVANPPVEGAVQTEHAHHHDHEHAHEGGDETHIHTAEESHDQHAEHEEHAHGNEHKSIGVSLVVGFVFMLVVDQVGGGHSHGGGGRY